MPDSFYPSSVLHRVEQHSPEISADATDGFPVNKLLYSQKNHQLL